MDEKDREEREADKEDVRKHSMFYTVMLHENRQSVQQLTFYDMEFLPFHTNCPTL